MEQSLQIAAALASAPPRRPRVLIGFVEALAAIESAWSLQGAGFEVLGFSRRGSRPPLRRSASVQVYELTPPDSIAAPPKPTCGRCSRASRSTR